MSVTGESPTPLAPPELWPEPPDERPPVRPVRALVALVTVAAMIVGAVTMMAWGLTRVPPASVTSTPPASSATGDGLAARVDPFVVDIFSTLASQDTQTAGTGIVVTSDGLVLTNNHVINQAASISVSDAGNGRSYAATVIGYDIADDLALLRLQGASGLPTATIGSSAELSIGQAVAAFGNANGAGGVPAMATGTIVSTDASIVATDEVTGSTETLVGLIETTARLESGYSGGPLVDSSGRVVGINTAAASGFRFNEPVAASFAVPIDRAMTVAAQIRSGRSTDTVHVGPTAFLGVRVTSSAFSSGALVVAVTAGSPADKAGISAGDVITSFAGQQVDPQTNLSALVQARNPGTTVSVEWADATGALHTAAVVLGAGPPA